MGATRSKINGSSTILIIINTVKKQNGLQASAIFMCHKFLEKHLKHKDNSVCSHLKHAADKYNTV